jgi:hypothetical protein
MDDSTRLFGKSTKGDWVFIRGKIISHPNDKAIWKEATELLEQRIETRYFKPIKRLIRMRVTTGEGFAVMTLVCSLVEFLQSCYEGKAYRHGEKERDFTYGSSSAKFTSFLLQHEPFKTAFSKPVAQPTRKIKNLADDFYTSVRCGLLHEAATGGGWTIRTQKFSDRKKDYLDVSDGTNKIIYRERFFEEIESYWARYKQDLIDNKKNTDGRPLRDGFCRKMDGLCDIMDLSMKWWKH